MADLSSLRTATRRFIDETDSTNSSYSDSELNDYLNQAARKVASMLEWPIAIYTATSVSEQAEYTLPTGFLSIIQVHFDGRQIEVADRADLEGRYPDWQNASSGQPVVGYRADNSVLGLYQKPSSTYAGKTIEAHCIKLPADLSADADVPDLQQILQDIMPIRAAAFCQVRAGNLQAATYLEQLFDKEVLAAKSKVNKFAEDLLGFRWY